MHQQHCPRNSRSAIPVVIGEFLILVHSVDLSPSSLDPWCHTSPWALNWIIRRIGWAPDILSHKYLRCCKEENASVLPQSLLYSRIPRANNLATAEKYLEWGDTPIFLICLRKLAPYLVPCAWTRTPWRDGAGLVLPRRRQLGRITISIIYVAAHFWVSLSEGRPSQRSDRRGPCIQQEAKELTWKQLGIISRWRRKYAWENIKK